MCFTDAPFVPTTRGAVNPCFTKNVCDFGKAPDTAVAVFAFGMSVSVRMGGDARLSGVLIAI